MKTSEGHSNDDAAVLADLTSIGAKRRFIPGATVWVGRSGHSDWRKEKAASWTDVVACSVFMVEGREPRVTFVFSDGTWASTIDCYGDVIQVPDEAGIDLLMAHGVLPLRTAKHYCDVVHALLERERKDDDVRRALDVLAKYGVNLAPEPK